MPRSLTTVPRALTSAPRARSLAIVPRALTSAPRARSLAIVPRTRSLAALALGLGLSAAVAIAMKEARRPRAQGRGGGPGGRGPRADQLGLRRGEPAVTGVRRMTVAQLDLAILTLEQAPGGELDLAVHETRKAIKRVRTLERLRRDASPRRRQAHRRAVLREAAAALSGARDAQVALDTLEGLMRRHQRKLATSPGVARLHSALLAEHHAAERALEESGARERALRLLRAVRAQVAAEPPAKPTRRQARVLDAGIARIYAQGRSAMRRARRRNRIAAMHEWRKRVKDLRHAAEALRPDLDDAAAKQARRGRRLRRLGRRADRLGEALGEEHDLALLAQRVRAEDEIFRGDGSSRKALLRAIARRRRRLRKRAFEAGGALYARRPKRFLKRLPRSP